MMRRLAVLCTAMVAIAATQARAGVILTIQEVGSDVAISGSGTLNLTALTPAGSGIISTVVKPNDATVIAGPATPVFGDLYVGFTGPTSIGPGSTSINPTSGSGDAVGIFGDAGPVTVPFLYVSGSVLTTSSTYSGQTLASMGITPGTYTWTWGSGATADSFAIIAASAVPEPSSLAMVGLGSVGLAFAVHRRRNGAAGRGA